VAVLLAVLVVLMVGAAYAAVPLYRLFCERTGFGGTVQRAAAAPAEVGIRTIEVRFDAEVNGDLPWDFAPEMKSVTVRPGETVIVNYRAHNRSDKPVTGTATYNVQPDKAGAFFNKIQCFCFEEQTLQPDETRAMPVQFFVDPELAKDPKNDDVTWITLSYTFFRAKNPNKENAP
jgi:cytochrome c oxidase assembly protein subunit 11